MSVSVAHAQKSRSTTLLRGPVQDPPGSLSIKKKSYGTVSFPRAHPCRLPISLALQPARSAHGHSVKSGGGIRFSIRTLPQSTHPSFFSRPSHSTTKREVPKSLPLPLSVRKATWQPVLADFHIRFLPIPHPLSIPPSIHPSPENKSVVADNIIFWVVAALQKSKHIWTCPNPSLGFEHTRHHRLLVIHHPILSGRNPTKSPIQRFAYWRICIATPPEVQNIDTRTR